MLIKGDIYIPEDFFPNFTEFISLTLNKNHLVQDLTLTPLKSRKIEEIMLLLRAKNSANIS